MPTWSPIDARYFHKAAGLETEHLLCFSMPEGMTTEEFRQERLQMAKAFVGLCQQNAGVEWSYRYPHELYVFPNTVNRHLLNGSRLYDELGYVETASAECLDPLDLVAVERANTELLIELLNELRAVERRPDLQLLKINLEYGKGLPYSSSNACHENYSISPRLFHELTSANSIAAMRHWIPYLVSRVIFCGAGCMGGRLPYELQRKSISDARWNASSQLAADFPPQQVHFQISQRADFMSDLFHLETMRFRPLVNLRDEPHANPAIWRRLHVIVGDTNRSDLSNYLKVGVTQLVLAMLECHFLTDDFELDAPLRALRTVSRDLSLQHPLGMAAGVSSTALDIQKRLLLQAIRFQQVFGSDLPIYFARVIDEWRRVLGSLENDPSQLVGELDWVTKLHYAERKRLELGISQNSPSYHVVDLDFSTLDDFESQVNSGKILKSLVESKTIERFRTEPPMSRAAKRCKLLTSNEVQSLTWDLIETPEGDIFLDSPLAHE